MSTLKILMQHWYYWINFLRVILIGAKQIVSYLKASSLYKSGQFASAIEYYTAAIKAYKNPLIIANATYWQAQANYELKEYALALELFQEVKRLPSFLACPLQRN